MARPSNAVLAGGLAVVVVGMVGASFAAVPLYKAFCALTGYGGTPQIGPETSATVSDRSVTVRFDADVDGRLPWQFAPDQPSVRIKLGEQQVAFYSARN
ncbi:MAG: cytochrome c oxidase assembly protein, partial [Acetobacteraceae bacterium]|nr:cytochrome c oxidase assembly protein [Acetobacteraceae bacterium]